jgi:hypothetical protein
MLNLNIMFEIATQYQIHLYFNVMLDDLVLFITANILVMDKTMHVIGYRYKWRATLRSSLVIEKPATVNCTGPPLVLYDTTSDGWVYFPVTSNTYSRLANLYQWQS